MAKPRSKGAKNEPLTGEGLIAPGEKPQLQVAPPKGEAVGKTLARMSLDPMLRNGHLAMAFAQGMFGDQHVPDIMQTTAAMADEIVKAGKGGRAFASKFYASQAMALDSIFTEMARRAANNMGAYPETADRYMRLALKAQAASRATLDSLTRLHQPREQTVKHVHVNDGGQAVVADQFHAHMHTGGQNEKRDEPAHDQHGEGPRGPALLGQDPEGNGMPITGDAREKAVPAPRGRTGKRSSARE